MLKLRNFFCAIGIVALILLLRKNKRVEIRIVQRKEYKATESYTQEYQNATSCDRRIEFSEKLGCHTKVLIFD